MKKKIVHYKNGEIIIDKSISETYKTLIDSIDKLSRELVEIEDTLKEELREVMGKLNVSECESFGIVAKLQKDFVRKSFDTTTFKNERPKLYEKYLVEKNIKGTLSLKVSD